MQFIWLRAVSAAVSLAAVSLAAVSFAAVSLTASAAQADAPLATSGQYTLTQAKENDVLAVWQIVAGKPLAPADRAAIQAIDISLFRHDPAWLLNNIKQTHKNLPRLQGGDAAAKADLRRINLIDIYCTPQTLHMTPQEAAGMQAVAAHYIPVVGVDAASGTVITERDLDAAVAASRWLAAKTKTPAYSSRYRSDLAKLADTPPKMGTLAERDLTDMERNWAAFQMTWPHEPASYQAQMLGRVAPTLRQDAAKGQGETGLAVASLALPELQYADYPYALDPRLAAYKRVLDARMSRFKTNMLEYNLLQQQRNMHDFARSMNGQGPDPQDTYNPIPVPTP